MSLAAGTRLGPCDDLKTSDGIAMGTIAAYDSGAGAAMSPRSPIDARIARFAKRSGAKIGAP